MEAKKLLIENSQPGDLSGCKPGVREHLAHSAFEFDLTAFELVPAFEFTQGNLCELRNKALATGKILANATDLEFLSKNQQEPMVNEFLDKQKGKWLVFLGTTYTSLQYHCSGEVRILTYDEKFGWGGDIPHCMDGDNVCSMFYVVFLNLKK